VLEVVFHRAPKPGDEGGETGESGEGEQMARNVQPLQLEPGKFTYRLVRAELELDDYGTIEAHCRIGGGPTTVVPYTLVPGPAAEAAPPIAPAGE